MLYCKTITKIKMFPGLRLPQILPHLTDPTRTCRAGPRLTALPIAKCGTALVNCVPEPSFDTLKSAQKQKKRSFPKKCYNSSKSAHLVVFILLGTPTVLQTAGSPSILATYIDTNIILGITLLGLSTTNIIRRCCK